MTEEKRALLAALNEISIIKKRDGSKLDLGFSQFSALKIIPAEILEIPHIDELELDNTQIVDLSPIRSLDCLERLHMNNVPASDLSPISTLERLEILDIEGTNVRDIEVIRRFKNLRALNISNTHVSDISPVSATINLEHFACENSAVQDLRPLTSLSKLGTDGWPGLHFEGCKATQRDQMLDRLSRIDDTHERTRETLAYLRSLPPWPEPYTPAATPDGSPPQPTGGQTSSPKQFAPLTLEAILTAQTPLGWRFSPDHGTMILYVEEQPLTAFQEQFAKMTADRLGGLLKLVGNANFGIRGDLRDEAERFDALLKDESRSLSLRSLELWGSLVALGSLLEANDDARRNGQDPIDLMTPQQRASLQTLLQVAGNLVRSFPDVQKLDDSAGGFLRKEVTLEIVAQLIDTAISTRFVDLQSAALMQHVKEVADSPGKQGDKAASATTRGASNMALTAAMIVSKPLAIAATGMAVGAAAQVGSEIAIEYQLGQRAISFIEAGKEKLSALIENLPPDEAAQLRSTLQDAQETIAQQSAGEE